MGAGAEKQLRPSGASRRAATRPTAAWSRTPALERTALRAIVGVPLSTKSISARAGAEPVRRAPTEEHDELQRLQRATREEEQAQRIRREPRVDGPGEDDDETPEQVQRLRHDGGSVDGEPAPLAQSEAMEAGGSSTADVLATVPAAVGHGGAASAAEAATPAARRACTPCAEEVQREALEPEEEEERVQRDVESPVADDADEDGSIRRQTAPRPQMAIAVGAADDEYEREADAVAERVMGMDPQREEDEDPVRQEGAASQRALRSLDDEQGEESVQRQERDDGPLEDEGSIALQREAAPADEEPEKVSRSRRRGNIGREGGVIEDAALAARLRSPGAGRPLPAGVRAFLERRLRRDFSSVRIHDTAEDRRDAAQLNARAFTYGRHIWIGPGDSADNPRLMAHELTHVVQQGAAGQVVRRDDGDEAQEPGFIARQALRLVQRYAPRLQPILRRGPVNWLRDQLAGVFNGLVGTVNRLNPRAALDQLGALFQGLLARAEPIVTALRSGDCGPLFQAMTDLKNYVTEIAGSAWDKLTDFLRPVGDFFTNLWNGYGAPALEWLQNFAGDLWDSIRQLGSDIWDWTQPVRDALGAAWDWVKEQLFGPEEESTAGDSQGGIIAWFQRKATEAWDWVKEQTRPVWQPVADAAAQVRALIPPAFVRQLGEQFRELSANINQAGEQMNGGEDVAENRAALASALPTVQQVIAGVRGIIVSSRTWLLEKIGLVSGAFTGLIARLRASSLLRALAALLGWMESAAEALGRWAREKVVGIFNWVLQAFDVLTPFVQKLITTVRNVISVVGDLLQLPSLVLNAVWNLIPACIRDPIRDFIVNQILARIPIFSTLLALPDVWNRIQATALRILRQVFVDGNLGRAAWTFFSSMLEVLGIPPQLVVGILAKAAAAIGDILADPVGFLLNLLSAIKEGFVRFFGNIWTHLLGGVTGWLFGHLTRAGIQPPQDFSLRSILGFVLQVLDITVERVFARLARRLDPIIVQRLRQALQFATGVWRFISILIEEGPAGLWREVQEQLGGLWNRVLDAVVGWVTRTVVERVTVRLLSMLDPTGVMAVVNSLIALYRAIQSAIEYLREMLMIVDRVLDGVVGIARGAIDVAAGFLETALASGIPVAIGFLANQIGLRNFGERIQEMVAGVRETVDGAIDWLIDRAIAGGQALINMLRRGVAAVRNWWTARKPFVSEEGESHTLYFEGSGPGARLMIRSDPQNYRDFINGVDVPPAKQAAKTEALQIAGELDDAVARAGSGAGGTGGGVAAAGPAGGAAAGPAGGAAAGPAGGAAGAATGTDPAAQINDLLDRLAAATARFIPRGSGSSSEPVYGPLANGFGSSVRVARLTSDHPAGSGPSAEGGHWDALRRRQHGGGTYYVRGHLLNDNLGGPGDTWTNLTPLTQSANNRAADSMLHGFETPVKNAVQAGKRVNFVVTANYNRTHPLLSKVPALQASANTDDHIIASIIRAEQYIPTTLQCSSHEVLVSGEERAAVATHAVDNRIQDTSEEDYQLTPQPRTRVYINEMSATDLQRLDGIDAEMAGRIVAGRPYRTGAQVRAAAQMTEAQWQAAVRTAGFHVRIFRLS